MPELPEVETIVRRLDPVVRGRNIQDFEAFWPRQVAPSISFVRRAILGRSITHLGRRGKYLTFYLDDHSVLVIHLGMSGRLAWEDTSNSIANRNHLRALWRMREGGRLLFFDSRKFGRIRHVGKLEIACGHLGLEPLEPSFTLREFEHRLLSCRRQLKPLLLAQTLVAGLGNIYTDEALFRARLHPKVCSSSLTKPQIKRLHRAIKRVLEEAVKRCGTSFDWVYPGGNMQHHLRAYGRAGKSCYRCKTPIKRVLVGQRATHFCPDCQPEPDEKNKARCEN